MAFPDSPCGNIHARVARHNSFSSAGSVGKPQGRVTQTCNPGQWSFGREDATFVDGDSRGQRLVAAATAELRCMAMTWGKRRAIVIGVLIIFLALIFWAAWKPERLASNSVLVIDADGSIEEQPPASFFGSLTGNSVPVLHDYLDAIDSARTDSAHQRHRRANRPALDRLGKTRGNSRAPSRPFARATSRASAISATTASAIPEYYLASACQQIWLVPSNPVSIRGMMAEALFFRGTLDKLKIVPEFYHIAEYKTATTCSPRKNLLRRTARKSNRSCEAFTTNI